MYPYYVYIGLILKIEETAQHISFFQCLKMSKMLLEIKLNNILFVPENTYIICPMNRSYNTNTCNKYCRLFFTRIVLLH